MPGFKHEYIARWQRVGLRLFSVWLLPMFVLLWLASWFSNRSKPAPIPGPGQHATLAPLWKRTLALFLDGAVLLAAARLLWQFSTWQLGLVWPSDHKQELADSLVGLEWAIRWGNLTRFRQVLDDSELDWLILPFEFHSDFFGILVASVLPVCIAMVFIEGRFGFTPGKWLAGIRVVRTTLPPCGFARALARKVMYWVDVPFLLTPIPAAVSIILSEHAQRIGDRIADTIVVDADPDPWATGPKRVLSLLAFLLVLEVTFSLLTN